MNRHYLIIRLPERMEELKASWRDGIFAFNCSPLRDRRSTWSVLNTISVSACLSLHSFIAKMVVFYLHELPRNFLP